VECAWVVEWEWSADQSTGAGESAVHCSGGQDNQKDALHSNRGEI
jgi:hypothetical protein